MYKSTRVRFGRACSREEPWLAQGARAPVCALSLAPGTRMFTPFRQFNIPSRDFGDGAHGDKKQHSFPPYTAPCPFPPPDGAHDDGNKSQLSTVHGALPFSPLAVANRLLLLLTASDSVTQH